MSHTVPRVSDVAVAHLSYLTRQSGRYYLQIWLPAGWGIKSVQLVVAPDGPSATTKSCRTPTRSLPAARGDEQDKLSELLESLPAEASA